LLNDRLFLAICYITFLFLTSLALYYTNEYPNYTATSLAVVVLPSPGSPLRRAAFELIVPDGMKEL
jgi:hypothetical protein